MPGSEPTESNAGTCGYCQGDIDDDNYLECQECEQSMHIKCLSHASTPGDLLGDVFFDFTCIKCVKSEAEQLEQPTTPPTTSLTERCVRQRIPWLLVLTLALYNLSIKSKGLGHHGYFHWRTHIISFVDKNWNYIFGPRVRRRKQWAGSVSGTLSHNNPEYFQSGLDLFQEHGWWKLAKANQTPRKVRRQYEQNQLIRQQQRVERRFPLPPPALDENSCSSELSVVTNNQSEVNQKPTEESLQSASTEGCARAIPYMGRLPKSAMPAAKSEAEQLPQPQKLTQEASPEEPHLSTVQASLMDFLAENLGGDDLFNNLHGIMPEPLIGAGKSDFFMTEALLEAPNTASLFEMETNFSLPATTHAGEAKLQSYYAPTANTEQQAIDDEPDESSAESEAEEPMEQMHDENEDSAIYQPRIVHITNYQAQEPAQIKEEPMEQTDQPEESEEEAMETKTGQPGMLEPCKPSGFIRQPRRNWPWLLENPATDEAAETADSLTMMSVYEEQQLQQRLHKIFKMESSIEIPANVRRLYRKLTLRKWKRAHNRPIFNLDEQIDPSQSQRQTQLLDRYQLLAHSSVDSRMSFHARIAGCTQHELFESPYTQRVLQPFIYRSASMSPPWLRLMCELQHRVSGAHPSRASIDFCYVRPQHIAAVNALLQNAFWPGIDVSECLSYPDYSVVALYKKLVVGCGFLVPDVGYNEAYISFMAVRPNWQRSGIASFMLYHLIQTCMSKDITLHVSASNSAVMLYQKFGFKIEEIILDFYDKYLPLDSKQSRNAFFLRLLR